MKAEEATEVCKDGDVWFSIVSARTQREDIDRFIIISSVLL